MGPRASLEAVTKKKIQLLLEIELWSFSPY
jgi:hypothetical protein